MIQFVKYFSLKQYAENCHLYLIHAEYSLAFYFVEIPFFVCKLIYLLSCFIDETCRSQGWQWTTQHERFAKFLICNVPIGKQTKHLGSILWNIVKSRSQFINTVNIT